MPANVTDRTAADAHLAEVEAEQAALRRIATLLARSVPPNEVFDAVVDEVRLLMRVDGAVLGRYEADKTVTVLAVSAQAGRVRRSSQTGREYPRASNVAG